MKTEPPPEFLQALDELTGLGVRLAEGDNYEESCIAGDEPFTEPTETHQETP